MISRRNFLKGAAAGAAGITAATMLGSCSASESEVSFDRESGVIVVGAGGAGLAAAVQAARDGADVLVLEKGGFAGGTTNYSGGVMQAAGTQYQKSMSSYQNDSPENHFKLWQAAGEGSVKDELIRDLAYGAPDHIEWLADMGLKWTSVYGHCNIPYVDTSLFADRIHVYEGGGGEGGGTILIQALLKAAEAAGASIEYNTEVKTLVLNSAGEVSGVIVEQGGEKVAIKATKAVILASGSIDTNTEMAKELSPQQYWDLTSQICLCAPTDTGDGIRMAMEAGAAVGGFGGTIDFCGKTGAATSNKFPMFPSFIVNAAGRRFVAEDATYAYHYRAIFQQEKQLAGPTWMVFADSSLSDAFARWTPETLAADIATGTVIEAGSIEELATKISVDTTNLSRTLANWNSDAAAGTDHAFGRKEGFVAMSGKFYAYKNVSFNLGAIGGVMINTDAQALKPNGEVFPRLYASGLNAGGWIGTYYPGSGTALIGLMHWGRKAGAHAAALAAVK